MRMFSISDKRSPGDVFEKKAKYVTFSLMLGFFSIVTRLVRGDKPIMCPRKVFLGARGARPPAYAVREG